MGSLFSRVILNEKAAYAGRVRIGAKSLIILSELKGEKLPDVQALCAKAKTVRRAFIPR
jgi:hypothetical protein